MLLAIVLPLLSLSLARSAAAEEFGGVEFPMGRASFADRVESFALNDAAGCEAPRDDPEFTLGPPDYVSDSGTNYTCLGNVPSQGVPSELVLEFVDNRLVDVDGIDVYIFEIGAAVEATSVAVSQDGTTWYDIGRIAGNTRGIDLANFSNVPDGALFRYIRLREHPDGNTSSAPYAGPDIDAVGAIGSDASDADEDGIHDDGDNCRDEANPDQANQDDDALGDACDSCANEPGAGPDGCPSGSGLGGAGGGGTAEGGTPAESGDALGGAGDRVGSSGSGSAAEVGGDATAEAGARSTTGGTADLSGSAGRSSSDDLGSPSGCGCRLGSRGSGPSALLTLTLVALSVARKRQRPRAARS